MSPQKRRPQARKGRTAAAAHKSRRKSDSTLSFVAVGVLIVGVLLVIVMRPSNSDASGLQLGDHWHAALGVYACDHWDSDASWATPVNATTRLPVIANTNVYSGLHSHADGLIHMEPQTSADTGENATLGNYFSHNAFDLTSTSVKFVTADLKNGDKCGAATGTLRWMVNGKERTGDPSKFRPRDNDRVVVAFLPDSKKITSLGEPPSVKNLPGATGRETPGDAPTSTSPSTPTSAAPPSPSTAPAPSTAPTTPTSP